VIDYQAAVIKDVCAWPNLTMLADGTIVAAIFNQPAHGSLPGDVDCWASEDQGQTWQKRGTAAPRPGPNTNRMNVAAGLAESGDLIVIASGYRRIGEDASWAERLLPAVVCRSADGGHTWAVSESFPRAPDGQDMIPFGDIAPGADGRLRATCYTAGESWATYMVSSPDDGRTWGGAVKIGDGINECAPLHLGERHWLAAIRTNTPADLRLFASDDDGATWTDRGPVTQPKQHPAHLLRLADGRILLTYGNRAAGTTGIEAKLSSNKGATWDSALRLLELPPVDLGYPSSVQLADGRILTAYYAQKGPGYEGYHMGVVIWGVPGSD
jgi:hypothetical protein